jgi:hypothetical protein
MSAHPLQQRRNGLRNGAVITPGMKLCQQSQSIGDGLRSLIEKFSIDRLHRVETARPQNTIGTYILPEAKKCIVV